MIYDVGVSFANLNCFTTWSRFSLDTNNVNVSH